MCIRKNDPPTKLGYIHNIFCHLDALNDLRVKNARPYNHNWIMQESLLKRYLEESEQFREFLGMSKKKQFSDDWNGFVNHKLNAAEKADFDKWDFHDDEVWLFISQANTEGYRFSTGYNSQNSAFTATLSCHDKSSANNGYSLSAFAPTWYVAVRSVLFKHIVVFNYEWDVTKANTPSDDWG